MCTDRVRYKLATLLLSGMLLLPACATVPPVAQSCPQLPPLPAPVPAEATFLLKMQQILSISPQTPIDYALPTTNSAHGLKP